jgi:hypothetical protein
MTYKELVNEANSQMSAIYNDKSKTAAERFIGQIQIKMQYEDLIAKALLKEIA